MTDADFGTTRPKASKDRICDDCGKVIKAGTQYVYWKGVHDGDFQSWSSHTECIDALMAFVDQFGWGGDEGYIPLFEIKSEAMPDELLWLRKHHPVAAKRIGLRPDPKPIDTLELFSDRANNLRSQD